jgi:hypothetical protein
MAELFINMLLFATIISNYCIHEEMLAGPFNDLIMAVSKCANSKLWFKNSNEVPQ